MALGQDIKAATLYRMVMPDHLCPYGLKSKDLSSARVTRSKIIISRRTGKPKNSRSSAVSAPQTFIGGRRIGAAWMPT